MRRYTRVTSSSALRSKVNAEIRRAQRQAKSEIDRAMRDAEREAQRLLRRLR